MLKVSQRILDQRGPAFAAKIAAKGDALTMDDYRAIRSRFPIVNQVETSESQATSRVSRRIESSFTPPPVDAVTQGKIFHSMWSAKSPTPRSAVAEFFNRVVVISLPRTLDRMQSFADRSALTPWPFDEPTVLSAIDGSNSEIPPWWREGGPAWGCLQSHRLAIQEAINAGAKSILIFEDDAALTAGAEKRIAAAIASLPADWDQLLLGGQQMHDGRSAEVSPGLSRVTQCERTHAYALSERGMRSLLAWWSREVTGHCDWTMGDWQASPGVSAYRIQPFVAYQAANRSTISNRDEPDRTWDSGTRPSKAPPLPTVSNNDRFRAIWWRLHTDALDNAITTESLAAGLATLPTSCRCRKNSAAFVARRPLPLLGQEEWVYDFHVEASKDAHGAAYQQPTRDEARNFWCRMRDPQQMNQHSG